MIIKIVRHGESVANSGEILYNSMPDPKVPLSIKGIEQAKAVGQTLGQEFLTFRSLVYRSPYLRTRQTLDYIYQGAGVPDESKKFYEDPRLREISHGYSKTPEKISAEEKARELEGWFYYQFSNGGESPAQCYDRVSLFIESMMRQVKRKNASRILIVSHGLTIRCLVMRWLHLTVEQFDALRNPKNCSIITIAPREYLNEPQFTRGKWGVTGLDLTPRVPKNEEIIA